MDKKRNIVLRVLFVLGVMVLSVVLMFVGQIFGELLMRFFFANSKNNVIITASMYFSFIGIWIVMLFYMGITKKNRTILECIWIQTEGNNWKNFILGVAIGFGLNALCVLAAWLNKDIVIVFEEFRPLSLIFVFFTVFVQSSAEELLCRGFLYQRLRGIFEHPAVAIIGNSALFAMLHLFNDGVTILSLLNILVVGILFSFMVYYLDSIWCAMAAHTAWNFTQNIIFGLPNSGIVVPFSMFKLDASTARNSFVYNVGFGIEGTLMADIVLIISCILLFLWGRKTGLEKKIEVTK